ncbi:MAG: rhodanese-like domain-containing protein, partial [Acidiferrobacterales bacterium]
GHIPGADYLRASFGTYYPVFEFNEVRLLEIVDKRQEIVIYSSSSGGDERDAANASAQAITWGFQKVYYFADGFQEWKAAGYPVEKGG